MNNYGKVHMRKILYHLFNEKELDNFCSVLPFCLGVYIVLEN